MRRSLILATLATLIFAACGGGAPSAEPRALNGTVTLTQDEPVDDTTGCAGTGGFEDIRDGAQVVLKDGEGKTIGTASLTAGKASGGNAGNICTHTFAFPTIPDAEFYSVEVSHRGALTYSKAELEQAGWTVSLTLGG